MRRAAPPLETRLGLPGAPSVPARRAFRARRAALGVFRGSELRMRRDSAQPQVEYFTVPEILAPQVSQWFGPQREENKTVLLATASRRVSNIRGSLETFPT